MLERKEIINDEVAPLIIRFDQMIRKVVEISKKESIENFREDTITLTWFYTLDSVF
jgi:hypothetical protein